jgi:protein ImuA
MYSIFVDLSPSCTEQSASSLLALALARIKAQTVVAPDARADSLIEPHDLPEVLRGELWRTHQLSRPSSGSFTATGFSSLDTELPGNGWPHRVLTELLVPHPGLGELRLLVPALSHIAGTGKSKETIGRCVMLFDPPAALCGWALAQLGVDAQQLLVVYGREGARGAAHLRHVLPSADLLWALEQALKSGHVGAALAWLPQRLKADALRRLQLAAQAHDGPVFLFREVEARAKPSAAPLRLMLQGAGIDRLSVRVLKRRGPPLAQPLVLSLPPVLSERLRVRGEARALPAAAPVLPPQQMRSVEASS